MSARAWIILGAVAFVAVAAIAIAGHFVEGSVPSIVMGLLGLGGAGALAKASSSGEAKGRREQAETDTTAINTNTAAVKARIAKIDTDTAAKVQKIEATADARIAAPTTDDEKRLDAEFGPGPKS